MAAGGAENAGVVAAGNVGGGYRDCHGGALGGGGCDVMVGNVTGDGGYRRGLEGRQRSTKTTTALDATETDGRIVNVGLVVAVLGVLSVLF